MAEFLTTSGVSFRLEELIKNAEENLFLITPFLQINERIKGLLEDRNRRNTRIEIIFGKTDLKPSESEWIEGLANIRIFYLQNLHSKCYLSERAAIVTSMNLYEFSQVNNHEMGIYVTREKDESLYDEIRKEVMTLRGLSEPYKITIKKVEKEPERAREPERSRKPLAGGNGHCIRCGKDIKPNIEKPYCLDCFKTWSQFENPEYEEKFCHSCGKQNKSTMLKPVCYTCFKSSNRPSSRL
jgi:phosphatidylserine/phosphatidylglycerophosphate/cardiolipin synthase-like enzyme